MGRPETIEETVERIGAAGGAGVAVRVDHTDPSQVRDLMGRIAAEHGRLDLLVNDIRGGDPLTEWDRPFWEHDLQAGLRMQRVVALAADPEVTRFSGRAVATWELMREYGFSDADGTQPDWGGYFEKILGPQLEAAAR